ncbi:uroporphyrinogen-III C-methyltransferase [Marinihelvus fidelis]|uniref:Siroheme synthase n=1 Tax=Marinihelvus fidelis TaxID=2613842 RepID=A0A5N0T4I2_9GAMM|nr:siroheme synthase CysG [Marinihelvus fidelis]KAA9129813.1 uroporphyrinogen-III C-methyltransferase [Marinihelvus fidelis]
MEYLPIFMKLDGRQALVVGGGVIATRKAELVAKSGARIVMVAPEFCDAAKTAAAAGGWSLHERAFVENDLDGCELAIAATANAAVNREVYRAARARHLPVNVADQPALCSFILPAIVDRSPAVVAISTGGRSPVLARYVKGLVEKALPARLGRIADTLGQMRADIHSRLPDTRSRRRFWERLLSGPAPDAAAAGHTRAVRAEAERLLADEQAGDAAKTKARGRAWLVGAGPGDPELLTLKAQRLLQQADVVLFDRLVPLGVLDMCRREAEMVYVGKRSGDHVMPQEHISQMLVRYVAAGQRVVRLKGGDPFVFGRGGEELEALVEAGLDFEVVPGVSAANGCAAYAGIPLTHRDHAQGVSFWTGHARDGELDLDWAAMRNPRQTQVFYMGAGNAALIREKLLAHGVAPTLPVALVQAGTTDAQRVLRTSVHGMAEAAATVDRSLPTLIIIGSVVNLRRDLGWFEGDSHADPAVFPPHLSRPAATVGDIA